MAKNHLKLKTTKGGWAVQEIPTAAETQEMLGVTDEALLAQKIDEIANLLWVHEDAREGTKQARIQRALELYESLEPADGAEGMLAAQMVGTHDAALECLRRAALPNQTYAGRDMALKHAQKLMTLYTKQLETLNKHRGKGQQKVTVEHVNVQPGGQAIVGTVEAGHSGPRQSDADPALEHQREVPAFEDAPKSRASRKKGPG
ncbi:MAG: hypothetical protein HUJ27_16695 [Rhodobacteraceae bacterium]|nr:hypothetical protein [Paracoccaceae bacterium]